MKSKPNLRVVLMADDAIVKEYNDPDLWRSLFNSRIRTRNRLAEAARVPIVKMDKRLDRLTGLAIIAPDERAFTVEALNIVADVYGVPVDVMRGPARAHRISTARSVVMYILRKHTPMTLMAIGAVFERHHSTVLSAIADIEQRRRSDETIERVLGGVSSALEQHSVQ